MPSDPDTAAWRPIATAPRDGTPILGAYDLNDGSFEAVVVWWNSDARYPWRSCGIGHARHRIVYWAEIPALPVHEDITNDR
jgi:hypothetical protein